MTHAVRCVKHVEHRFDRQAERGIGLHEKLNEWQPCDALAAVPVPRTPAPGAARHGA